MQPAGRDCIGVGSGQLLVARHLHMTAALGLCGMLSGRDKFGVGSGQPLVAHQLRVMPALGVLQQAALRQGTLSKWGQMAERMGWGGLVSKALVSCNLQMTAVLQHGPGGCCPSSEKGTKYLRGSGTA